MTNKKEYNDKKVGLYLPNNDKLYVVSLCGACQDVLITYDHELVHSIRRYNTGERVPLCPNCFQRWNKIHRLDNGLEPIPFNKEAYIKVVKREQKIPK